MFLRYVGLAAKPVRSRICALRLFGKGKVGIRQGGSGRRLRAKYLQRIDEMFSHVQPARRNRHREQLLDVSFQPILAHSALHGTSYPIKTAK